MLETRLTVIDAQMSRPASERLHQKMQAEADTALIFRAFVWASHNTGANVSDIWLWTRSHDIERPINLALALGADAQAAGVMFAARDEFLSLSEERQAAAWLVLDLTFAGLKSRACPLLQHEAQSIPERPW